jgi:PAS domain S-box-containing protein
MNDQHKTKAQLIEELAQTRDHVAELEQVEATLRESEEKYRTIFENVNDSITYIDKYGTIISTNNKEEIFGRKPEEIMGKNFTKLGYFDVRDIPKYLKLLKDVVTGKKTPKQMELEVKHKDGHKFPVEMSTSLVKKDGKTAGFVCITRDITERKRAEEEFQQQTEELVLINELNNAINRGDSLREVLQLLSDKTAGIFSAYGATTYLLSPDEQYLAMENIPLDRKMLSRIEKLVGIKIPALRVPLSSDSIYKEVMQSKEPRLFPDPEIIRTQITCFINESNFPNKLLRTSLKKVVPQIQRILGLKSAMYVPLISEVGVFGLIEISSKGQLTDTDLQRLETLAKQLTTAIGHKQAAEALEESERRYRQIIEEANDPVYTADPEGYFTYANPPTHRLTGYSRVELSGMRYTKLVAPKWVDRVKKFYIQQLENRVRNTILEFPILTRSGEEKWIEQKVTLLTESGRVTGFQSNVRDITDRKRAEEALRRSESRYRSLVEDMPALICRFLPDGTLCFVNDAYCQCFGKRREDLVGHNFFQFIPAEERPKVRERYSSINKESPVITYEHPVILPDGTLRWQRWTDRGLIDESGAVSEYQSIGEDITERKQVERELTESKKYLSKQNVLLNEKNVALREMIRQINEEKNRIEVQVIMNVEQLVLPIVARLKESAISTPHSDIELLEQTLENIVSGFSYELFKKTAALSPREIEIGNMIRAGRSTKEIAGMLHLSAKTVETHRNNIRKKLGIRKTGANLSTYLKAL